VGLGDLMGVAFMGLGGARLTDVLDESIASVMQLVEIRVLRKNVCRH